MPPRAFPYPLKVGIDICYIPRIKSILTKNVGTEKQTQPLSRFLYKLLTWPERQYFFDRFGPSDVAYGKIDRVSQYLAGRWAAKEACRKACTHMGKSNGLHQIIILPIATAETEKNSKTTAPQGLLLRSDLDPHAYNEQEVEMTGAGRPLFDVDKVEGQFFEVSITHDGAIAQAVAMVPTVDWGQSPG